MQKSFLILPLTALLLTACNNQATSSSSEVADTTANTEWQAASIQPAPMPSSMNQPTISQPQTVAMPTPAATNYGTTTETVGNCQVVRDAEGTPIYAQISKGCYTDSKFTVGKQDTLYLIGYLAGKTPAQIAALNGLSVNSQLKVGQALRVK